MFICRHFEFQADYTNERNLPGGGRRRALPCYTDLFVYYQQYKYERVNSAWPVAKFSQITLEISGSTVEANNGIFSASVQGYLRPGVSYFGALDSPQPGDSIVWTLPSNRMLVQDTPLFENGLSSPSIGDDVKASHFEGSIFHTTPAQVLSSSGNFVWQGSYGGIDVSRTIVPIAVPEPSSLLIVASVALMGLFRRTRKAA